MTDTHDHRPRNPLYLSDAELIERLNCGEKRGRAAIRAMEREGFPQPDPLIGKRYFPAVKRFLDVRNGLAPNSHAGFAPDGEEHWDDDNDD